MGGKGVPAVPKSILQLTARNISTLTFFCNHDVLTVTLRLDGLLPNLFHKAFIEEDEARTYLNHQDLWKSDLTFPCRTSTIHSKQQRQLASLIQTLCLCNFRKSSGLPKQSFTSAYYKQVCFFFFLRAQHFSKRGFQPEMGSQNLFSGVTSSGQPCVYSQ